MQDQDKRNSNKGGKLAKPMTVGISFSIRKHRPANGTRPCRAKDATDFLKKVSPFSPDSTLSSPYVNQPGAQQVIE
jgi:hypothetical protein